MVVVPRLPTCGFEKSAAATDDDDAVATGARRGENVE